MQPLLTWLQVSRPKTLILAATSIFVGNGLAFQFGSFSWSKFGLCLLTAFCLQILANLANDYGDHLKGTDDENRLGPKRVLQSSTISLAELYRAIWYLGIGSTLSGLILLFISVQNFADFMFFIALGITSIAAALFYTMGKTPYGYSGFGDLSVFLFFGLVGVLGCYYLQTGHWHNIILLPAMATGLLSCLVLNMNNLRDYRNDKFHGKKTLVVYIGIKRAKIYHAGLIGIAFLLLAIFLCYAPFLIWAWLYLLAAPLAFQHGIHILDAKDPNEFITLFSKSILVSSTTTFLFSLGLFLS